MRTQESLFPEVVPAAKVDPVGRVTPRQEGGGVRGVRVVGTLEMQAWADGVYWVLSAIEPHVALRLKRLLGRVDTRAHGRIRLLASDEASRDLEWFASRFPLRMTANVAAELTSRARAYDTRLDEGWRILDRAYRPNLDTGMALPPRPYQALAADLLRRSRGLLVADELGLGKTVTAITAMTIPGALPAAVMCPPHLVRQWRREIGRFLPALDVHAVKRTEPYPLAGKSGRLPDVVLVSEGKMSGWARTLGALCKLLVVDECQSLRRSQSARYAAASHVARQVTYRLGLSGTPIHNYGGEWWNVLDVLAPGHLGTPAEFLREWCSTFGGGDKARLKDPKAFGRYLREQLLMLRRTRADVGEDLPPATTFVQEVEADPHALEEIREPAVELARVILAQGGKGLAKMKAASEFSNRLRQATGVAKAPAVAGLVRMLVEDGQPVVVWGWHREVYAIWADLLRDLDPAWYTGTESPAKKEREAARFLSGETDVLFMSLRSGAGLDGLQTCCCTGVFGELDWSPGVHQQCEGRLLRSGQTKPVFTYYVAATSGADPIMVDVLGVKRGQLEGVRDPSGDAVVRQAADPEHIRRLAADYLERAPEPGK